MKLSPIHQSNEERLATTSQGVLSVAQEQKQKMEEMTKAIEGLGETAKDKSEETKGFAEVVQTLKETNKTMSELKDYVDHPEVVVRKLEEVKSASLITNKLLKEIAKKEAPEPKEFPTQMKMEIVNKPNEAALAFFSMLKGDAGKDSTVPGPRGSDGKDGAAGKNGKDGKDGVGKQGEQGARGEQGEAGKDGSPDTPDEIIEKINKSKKRISASRVQDLTGVIRQAQEFGSNPQGQYVNVGGANPLIFLDSTGARISDYITTVKLSTGVTQSVASGVLTLSVAGSSGTAVYSEIVAGNTSTFTLANTPTAGTVRVFALGQRLVPTTDFSIAGAIITTVSTWSAGQILSDYSY